jgi:hypothetical protein
MHGRSFTMVSPECTREETLHAAVNPNGNDRNPLSHVPERKSVLPNPLQHLPKEPPTNDRFFRSTVGDTYSCEYQRSSGGWFVHFRYTRQTQMTGRRELCGQCYHLWLW